MSIDKKGEFVVETTRVGDNQMLYVRQPLKSGAVRDIFKVRAFAEKEDPNAPIDHHVYIFAKDIDSPPNIQKVARSVTFSDMVAFSLDRSFQGTPSRYHYYEYITEPGGPIEAGEYLIVGERHDGDGEAEVLEDGNRLVFTQHVSAMGSNRLWLPRDLRPFVGHVNAHGSYEKPHADLRDAVEFETYRM